MQVAKPVTNVNKAPHVASYYLASARNLRDYPALRDDQRVDVCVIGAGFTGLSAALHLRERGYSVAVLEANRIGWGASGRNGGQLGSGQRRDQSELEARFGKDKARILWGYAEEAKALVKDIIRKYDIECDLKPGVMHAAHRARYYPEYRDYAEKLQRDYGYDRIRAVTASEMRDMLGVDTYYGGNLDMGAAHLHPLNLAIGLARAAHDKGVDLYEASRVLRYREGRKITAETVGGRITASHLILACNGYLDGLAPKIARRIMPINNFIIATEPLSPARARQINRDDVAVADSRFVINYFRLSADNRLLFGGGENYSPKFPADLVNFVRPYMLQVYPQLGDLRIDYAWGGTLAITVNRHPHFGKLGRNIYFAQGYSGHGLALSHFAGKIIAEAVAGSAEKFDVMASLPTHIFPGGRYLRWPLLALGMTYYALRDRL